MMSPGAFRSQGLTLFHPSQVIENIIKSVNKAVLLGFESCFLRLKRRFKKKGGE